MELEIFEKDGRLLIDSREVADKVSKRHSDLLRDIEGYKGVIDQNADLRSDDFFVNSIYKSGTGKDYKCYLLTKKGCDMVANKMTGEKGVLFTATYVTAFEQAKEENKQLTEDNNDLHKIAVSEDDQAARQYQADKVRYSWKNIRKVLENSDYKSIEDEVNKIIDFHSNDLKKKDRANYDSHQNANKTEYKQMVRERVFNVLDDINNTTNDGVLRAVTSELRVNVVKDKISTKNRSYSMTKSNDEQEKEDMMEYINQLDPDDNEYVTLSGVHGFSINYMYEYMYGKRTKTKAYKHWIKRFPYHLLPDSDEWDIDWTKPIRFRAQFDAEPKFDADNLMKSLVDIICNHYEIDDNIVKDRRSKISYEVHDYKDGEIRFHLENI